MCYESIGLLFSSIICDKECTVGNCNTFTLYSLLSLVLSLDSSKNIVRCAHVRVGRSTTKVQVTEVEQHRGDHDYSYEWITVRTTTSLGLPRIVFSLGNTTPPSVFAPMRSGAIFAYDDDVRSRSQGLVTRKS